MFGGISKLPYQPVKTIFENYNQEWLFLKYTGIYPDTKQYYTSLFRADRTPGCRFEWRSGVLYFIDNASYRGKTHFDIIGVVENLFNVNTAKAINMIQNDNKPDYQVILKNTQKQSKHPEIRFTYKNWPSNNYFKISPNDLERENVYLVDNYWIKDDDCWKQNHIHNPHNKLTIAYYFPETNHTKLYWPFEKVFKWYSNCNTEIFGESKLNYYLEKDDRLIVITKSQKDRLILDYLCDIPAIAPQTEHVLFSNNIINKCKKFKKQIILYDNDITGQNQASKLSEITGFPWVNLEIGKDVYDNVNNLKYIKNLINK